MSKLDYILIGNLLLPDFSNTSFGALGIKGNRIAEIVYGKNKLIDTHPEAKVIDCTDNMIIPGFHDSHTHILQGTIAEEGALLREAFSEEEAAKILYKEISNKDYDLPWIFGGGWDHFKWPNRKPPSKESLDKYFPSQPVFLLNKECHGAWVNTLALEYFNIDEKTPDPPNGMIFRDKEGKPTGYLHEDAALNFTSLIYDISDFEHLKLVEKFSERAAKNGITSVSDMQIYNTIKYKAINELDYQNRLNVRVHFCPPITEKIEKLKFLQKKYCSPKLQFSGAKGFVDGTPMGYTGLMIREYSDRPGFYGNATMDSSVLEDIIVDLDKAGIRCRLHACGDGAVRLALNVFEKAQTVNGRKDIRHTIEHIECIEKDDVSRFKELGVIASVQPDHMPKYDFSNHPFHSILGKERLYEAWPFKTLEDKGARLSFGTDYPIAPLNPMRGIYRAITRLTDDENPEIGFSPEERISLSSALKAYTLGSAYCNFRENELGTLEVNKIADIVVLEEDLFKIKPENIIQVGIKMTIFDGEPIYSAEAWR